MKNTLYFISPWVFLANIVINMGGWFQLKKSNINFKKSFLTCIFSKPFPFSDRKLYALSV